MSDQPTRTAAGRWARLPDWMAPLDRESTGRGDLRRVEITLLVILGLLLATATVNDLVRQAHVNHRLVADLHTWRTLTGHDYRNISLEQDVHHFTNTETACGNTSPGPPESVSRVCLVISGPVRDGLREEHGGYYLPAYVPDLRINRYGCFGSAKQRKLCGLATPAGAPHTPLASEH
jgi:hypothetical protein